jgi:fatty-acyl-CoA synthase
MQNDFQLTVGAIRRRMRRCYGDQEVVTLQEAPSPPARATYAEVAERVERLGRVLERLGVAPGERVGTFGWNSQRHFELYLAIPSFGAVLHTVNVRLFPDQIAYIVNHAQDRVIFVDDSLAPGLASLAGALEGVRHFVVMGDGDDGGLARLGSVLRYEELLEEAGPGDHDWPDADERSAAALCYTSGTTGNPKGVLYSHRSVALHSTAVCMADAVGLSQADRVLAIVPMFHVNAWGLPFAAALTGAGLVLPSRFLAAPRLAEAIAQERATMVAGVPTVLGDLLRHADEHGSDLSSLEGGICGGAAVPRRLMEGFERHGVRILHAWGMTETSPVCTVARPPAGLEDARREEHWDTRVTQGRVVPWVELRLAGDDGEPRPWDGESTGEIEVRGPWVARRYYEDDTGDDKFSEDGWMRTGDIGSVTPEGFVRITDRAKDLIKSGGEWISSVELETQLMEHPAVIEAAVIAMPDDRWTERPLACVVVEDREGADLAGLRGHLAARMASWQVPDCFALIDEVPKTSVGKFDKKVLRKRLAAGELEIAVSQEGANA